MTPTIADVAELIGAAFVILVLLALFIAWGVERTARRRAEQQRDLARSVARIAGTRRDVLANRLRAAGLSDVVTLDAEIRSYADARQKAGA